MPLHWGKCRPPPHSFHAYIDDVRWVFQGSQKELTDILNQYLRRPEIKLVGHALKVDAIQLILFGVDLRDQLHLCTYDLAKVCLLYTSPSPRDSTSSRMPSSA